MLSRSCAVALSHNVPEENNVQTVIDKLVVAGAAVLREDDEPPQGGGRGYIADPGGHIWEIGFNPLWPIDEDGHVAFKMLRDESLLSDVSGASLSRRFKPDANFRATKSDGSLVPQCGSWCSLQQMAAWSPESPMLRHA